MMHSPLTKQPAQAAPVQLTARLQPSTTALGKMLNDAPRVKSIAQTAGLLNKRQSGQPGLPYDLKSGVEALSGVSMDHVNVHYNSDKPSQVNAHAYTQGAQIHVAPGQEKHLPHEAWHVVQQAQGRVQPTMQMNGGTLINDQAQLEGEADQMGARAMQLSPQIGSGSPATSPGPDASPHHTAPEQAAPESMPIQRVRGQNEYQYLLNTENRVRQQIPRAGNQIEDLMADPNTLARHELTRYMNTSVLGTSPGANDLDHAPLNTLGTAMSAFRYGGGMCNEYSALSFAHHMASPLVSGQPIVRYWNPGMHHSFTAVGDERDPNLAPMVADPWTMDREPALARDTVMAGNINNVVATWADRMPGEGANVVNDAHGQAMRLFDIAEQNPFTRAHVNQEWNQNRANQVNAIAATNAGNRPDWIWNHRTDRR